MDGNLIDSEVEYSNNNEDNADSSTEIAARKYLQEKEMLLLPKKKSFGNIKKVLNGSLLMRLRLQ